MRSRAGGRRLTYLRAFHEIVGPSDGQLVITAEQGTTLIAQRMLKENTNYHCDKDGVFLRLKQDAGGYDKDVAAMAIGWKSERYSKAVDGSLIIRRTVRGGGVFMFLPLISSSEDWSRFPAVASPRTSTFPGHDQTAIAPRAGLGGRISRHRDHLTRPLLSVF